MAKRIVADDAKFSAVSVGKEKAVFPVEPDKKPGDALSASLHKKKYRDKDVEDEALDDQLPVIADAEQVTPDSAFAAAEQLMLLAQADAALAPASDSAATGQTNVSNSGSNTGWWWLGAGVVATGAGIGVGVSGGGGGGNGSGTTTITGTVTDGPVQGARLYIDVNGNGTYDVGTDTAVLDANGDPVVTDASGNFSFTVTGSGAGIKLVTNGGIDTVTGEAVTLDFSAPSGYSQLNPITSAIAAYMQANPEKTAAQAEADVESALGLPDLDYSTVNLADPAAGLAAQRAVAILATAAIIIEQSGTDADAFQYIAENLGVSGSTSALVTAVQSADPSSAAQLADTVAAIEAATDLTAIDNALNDTFHNDPPVFISATTATVAENSSAVMIVAATDPDPNGQIVTYSITGGADQAKFTINSTTGALAFIGAPDFENPTDSGGNNSYEVQVTADDGNGGSTTQTVTATVTNVNEAPVITSASTGTVAENAATSTVVYTAAATDVDAGDSRTYSLSGTDAALFNIDATSGAVTLKTSADYEAATSYAINVIATDAGGLTATQAVTVNVTNVNEAPVITSASTGTVAENAATSTVVYTAAATDADAGDTRTYSLSGTDAALFNIDATSGAVTLKNSANYEAATSYAINVIATDAGGLTATQAVTVNVTNVNEAPVITSASTGTVAENAATSTVVYTAVATDIDAGDTRTYSLSGTDAALFNIDATSGAVTLKNSADYEAVTSYAINVIATDAGGLTATQAVTVNVTDLNDNTPIITSGGVGSVIENVATSTVIYDAAATDADAGTTITYSLKPEGPDFSLLSIDPATGEVTLISSADYENRASYNFTVIASDGTNSSEQAVTVNVTNVHESVVVDSTGAWIDLNANGVKDAEDTTGADFTAVTGNIDFTANPITIHFNDVPDTPLDLTGFTDNDKIEIDVVEFNAAYMQTSPANGFTALVSNITPSGALDYVSMTMDNSMYFTPFLQTRPTHLLSYPSAATLPAANKGALAFYDIGYKYLAYWTDSANPLRDIQNILPGIKTTSNFLTSGTNTALAALNQGAGLGLVDFIWGNPFPATAVVVESTGAWIDTNADGVHDVNETTPWVGGHDNLAGHQVTIHFNSVPNQSLDLAGFGSDDLIEIDVQAFINNGHNALNILTRPNILKTDEFNLSNTLISTSNWLTSIKIAYANFYTTSNGLLVSARVGLSYSYSSLYFTSNNGSGSTGYQLATGIFTNLPLQQMVDFVNFPEPPETVHVVVGRDGAVIDYDGDGVRDSGENRLAVFSAGGNADLTGATPVIIHFNDLPSSALDLTGFGTDDRIEIDVNSLRENSLLSIRAANEGIVSISIGAGDMRGYNFTNTAGTSSRNFRIVVNQHATVGGPSTSFDFSGVPYPGAYGLSFASISNSVNGRTQGLVAYWMNPLNALNNDENLLPDLVMTPTSNQANVIANLNNNHYPGLVEFVWPVNVVVDDQAGHVATFIDANGNGVRDLDEDTLALLGQTQADVDAFNAAAGTVYGSQVVDLASEQVTIHYNDLPTGAWVPDLTGFNGNDRIQIDLAALQNNVTVNDTVSLNNQPTRTMSSQTQVYAGVSGVSSGNTAVYISGGNLKFGHRTTIPITPTSTAFNAHYTTTGTLEGVLASNAGALANHFQQVAFVTAII